MRQPQHPIERRADFVAHIGQELALDPRQALGFFTRRFALGSQGALLGHVANHGHDLIVAQGQQNGLQNLLA